MKPYYEHGGIVLYHADCRDVDAWLTADVLVSDPPYGMAHSSGWSARPIAGDDNTLVRDAALSMWGEKPALIFGRWNCPHPSGAKMALTWDKGDWPGMGDLALPWGPSTEEIYVLGEGFVGQRRGSVIRIARLTGDILHPNEKPVSLVEHLIVRCPAGTIADPFAGSGTALVAAKNLGRRAIGVEVDEQYCEIAAKRLSQEVLPLSGAA